MVKKLSLFILMSALSFSTFVHAAPMATLMDKAQPAYYKLIFTRFFNWYETRTKNSLREKLSTTDQAYVTACLSNITDWSYQMAPNTYWNYLRISPAIKNNILTTQKLAIGPTQWSDATSQLAQKVLKEKKVVLPKGKEIQDILWLEWDLDNNLFAIYFKDSLANKKNLVSDMALYNEKILIAYFYQAGKIKETKVFASRKTLPEDLREKYIFAPMVTDMVDVLIDKKISNQIFEVSSFSDQFINEPLRSLANEINEQFRFLADSLNYQDMSNMEIYYP